MINKRLIGEVSESKKYIAGNVTLQWCSLAANITVMTNITSLLGKLYANQAEGKDIWTTALTVLFCLVVRFVCTTGAARMGYLSSRTVKKTLREKIYKKLLSLGTSYKEYVQTSEVVQVAVEGVKNLQEA